MDSTEQLIKDGGQYLMPTYARYPVVLVRGRGMRVWDPEGREYLDFVGGVAVNILGHCHPKVVAAIQDQAARLIHVSNYFQIEPQIRLARLLAERTFADQVFFCNSGAEAVEASLKLARRHMKAERGKGRHQIIATHNSFHGRTLATLTATGQPKFWEGYDPLVPGFVHVPYGDLQAVEQAITEETAAVLVEPIQGEGGVVIPPPDYLPGLRALCDRHGILLILDEVQTGMGRTGRLFAHEHAGVAPDLMAVAKGLGGGVAIGALLAKREIARSFGPGSHGSTFGGNPLACAAGAAVLEAIDEEHLLERCQKMGAYFRQRLDRLRRFPVVKEIRGLGLLLGVELSVLGKPAVEACLKEGFLINVTSDRVLRFMPPLLVAEADIDRLMETLERVLSGIS